LSALYGWVMKNFPKAATGVWADAPASVMAPRAVWARQLMIGTIRWRRSTPPVVVSTPLAPRALAQNGAPLSVWNAPGGLLEPCRSGWPLLVQPFFPDQSSIPPTREPWA